MAKLKLIQCGVAGHGGSWIRDISTKSPDFDLAAIVDVVQEKLDAAGEAAGVPKDKRFASLEKALKEVQADAVLTVTPPAVHVEHARLTFGHGLHLITEKPIADNIENAKRMVKLASDAGKQLVVSQNYRFASGVQTLKKLVQQNAAGAVGHGHLDFYIPGDFTGTFRETMEFPLLVDMAIHHLDLIRCVTGRNIAKITAQSFRPAWSWYQHDPGLKMLMELDGGIPFSYSGDWSALGRNTSWSGNWRLQCTDGALHFENDKVSLSRSERWGKNQTVDEIPKETIELNGAHATLHALAEAIRTGQPAETSGQDNLHSFGAVIAGVKSAKEGRTVEVREIIGA